MASPTFVAATDTQDVNVDAGTDSYTLVANIPAHSNGDLLVAFLAITDNTNNPMVEVTTPSGWTKHVTVEGGDFSAIRLSAYTITGNGLYNVVPFVGPSNAWAGSCTIIAYSGANTSSPVDVSTSSTTESTADVTAGSVTTTVADTKIIWAYAQDDDTATEADVNTDAGFSGTLRGFEQVASGVGNGICHAVSDADQASAGASATCVFSMNGDTEAAVTITLAIAPSAAGIAPIMHHRRLLMDSN